MQADLDDACGHLALSVLNLTDTFVRVAKHLHTIDILALVPPFKQRWSVLDKSFRVLLWHFRSNAGLISARLKMFYTVVLPLTARNPAGSRSHDEKLQVLRSFITISADHAALTRNLVTNAMKFNHALNAFHTDFCKFASQKVTSGQNEIRDLLKKLSDLENTVVQLCLANGKISGEDVAHYAFISFRTASVSRRKCGRATPRGSSRKQTLNTPELASVGRLYEHLDVIKGEVSHAQYTTQVCQRKPDAVITAQTFMSTLVSEEMITMECGLSFLLSIWSRLQADCTQLSHWLQSPKSNHDVPLAIVSLLDGGNTLYATVANALDAFVMGMDPVHFATNPGC